MADGDQSRGSQGEDGSDPPESGTVDDPSASVNKHISQPTKNLDDLLNPLRDLGHMRERLFEVKEPIELQPDEFDHYWPYVDNIWVRQHKAGADKTGRLVTDYYACRLQRPTYTPKPVSTPRREGQPTRKKQIREGGTCQMRLKTVKYQAGYTSYTIVRVGEATQHTHDLDHIDKIKRTSVLMDIARSEVMKGYMPASVFTIMTKDTEKLSAAGGRHLSRNDVRNASQHWRQQHREELRVHEGYKYDHGNGIVRHDGSSAPYQPDPSAQIVDPALTDTVPLAPDTLRFPISSRGFLDPYLPPKELAPHPSGFPYVTLTYATSLDSSLALAPGVRTALSGPESKAMTHYLRSKHDAILIGVGTAIADNPTLNCRLEGVGGFGGLGWEGQPRPVIIDPGARWLITPQTKIIQAVQRGQGRAPWVIMAPGFAMDRMRVELLDYYGGNYLGLSELDKRWRLRWEAILKALAAKGIKSVMIEGGGMVINDLLQLENANYINSVVVTVAPTYLGRGGVTVSPFAKQDVSGRPEPAVRFHDVRWQPLGEDIVMCGRLASSQLPSEPALPTQSPTGHNGDSSVFGPH